MQNNSGGDAYIWTYICCVITTWVVLGVSNGTNQLLNFCHNCRIWLDWEQLIYKMIWISNKSRRLCKLCKIQCTITRKNKQPDKLGKRLLFDLQQFCDRKWHSYLAFWPFRNKTVNARRDSFMLFVHCAIAHQTENNLLAGIIDCNEVFEIG